MLRTRPSRPGGTVRMLLTLRGRLPHPEAGPDLGAALLRLSVERLAAGLRRFGAAAAGTPIHGSPDLPERRAGPAAARGGRLQVGDSRIHEGFPQHRSEGIMRIRGHWSNSARTETPAHRNGTSRQGLVGAGTTSVTATRIPESHWYANGTADPWTGAPQRQQSGCLTPAAGKTDLPRPGSRHTGARHRTRPASSIRQPVPTRIESQGDLHEPIAFILHEFRFGSIEPQHLAAHDEPAPAALLHESHGGHVVGDRFVPRPYLLTPLLMTKIDPFLVSRNTHLRSSAASE